MPLPHKIFPRIFRLWCRVLKEARSVRPSAFQRNSPFSSFLPSCLSAPPWDTLEATCAPTWKEEGEGEETGGRKGENVGNGCWLWTEWELQAGEVGTEGRRNRRRRDDALVCRLFRPSSLLYDKHARPPLYCCAHTAEHHILVGTHVGSDIFFGSRYLTFLPPPLKYFSTLSILGRCRIALLSQCYSLIRPS